MKFATTLFAVAVLGGCVVQDIDEEGTSAQDQQSELFNKHAHPVRGDARGGHHGGGGGNGISYHGGPVMLGTPTIHFIWYGNWSSGSQNILNTLVSGLSGSTYEAINGTYYDGSNTHVSGAMSLGSSSSDSNESLGNSLADADIQSIVAATNPTDTDALYMVMTSADVNETSGFCTQYCGWHTHGTINGRDIKYAFVGNPNRCPSACMQQTTSPNGDPGADGAASIVAHESEEAISDPDLNAWYDHKGQENADKCAWTFGVDTTTTNHNVTFGGHDWLIQRNWVNAGGGYCALSY